MSQPTGLGSHCLRQPKRGQPHPAYTQWPFMPPRQAPLPVVVERRLDFLAHAPTRTGVDWEDDHLPILCHCHATAEERQRPERLITLPHLPSTVADYQEPGGYGKLTRG